jgi:DNA-binding transcriptional regulator YdaS (Cro superfamily)
MEESATPFEALKAAVARVGSQAAMGRLLHVSQPTVWKWLQSSKRLPAEHCLVVERETGVSRHLLRPDIYPADPMSDPLSNHDACEPVGPRVPAVACDRGALLNRAARA